MLSYAQKQQSLKQYQIIRNKIESTPMQMIGNRVIIQLMSQESDTGSDPELLDKIKSRTVNLSGSISLPTAAIGQNQDTGIPVQMQQKFEEKSGFSYDDVKVHYNSNKPAEIGALAYTQGNQVYISPGQEEYLEHELGHVAQQKAGLVQTTGFINSMPMNDDTVMEHSSNDTIKKQQQTSGKENRVIQMAKFIDHEFGSTAAYTWKQEQIELINQGIEYAKSCLQKLLSDYKQKKIDSFNNEVKLYVNKIIGVLSDNALEIFPLQEDLFGLATNGVNQISINVDKHKNHYMGEREAVAKTLIHEASHIAGIGYDIFGYRDNEVLYNRDKQKARKELYKAFKGNNSQLNTANADTFAQYIIHFGKTKIPHQSNNVKPLKRKTIK